MTPHRSNLAAAEKAWKGDPEDISSIVISSFDG
jgi:hypothetical protein